MQYLLTQQEYDKLVPKAELDNAEAALELARVEMLRLAKFTCIHNNGQSSRNRGYCDACPAGDLSNLPYMSSKLICTLSRNYSQ
jgi:hypothetical protein